MRMWIVSIGEILNVMKSVYCKHRLHYSENTVFTLSRLVPVDWMISLVLIKVEPHSLKIRSHSHATGSPSSHPNDVPDFRSAGCSSVPLHTQLLDHYSTIDSVPPCPPLPNYPVFPSLLPSRLLHPPPFPSPCPMNIIPSFLLLTLLSFSHASTSPTPSPPARHLLFVAELCRHGDRTPLTEFPSDALPVSKWPEGVGQLTAIGIRAQFDLGSRLRARYVDTGFLPSTFNVRDIYVRSTDVDRTLMSATSQIAGLYPPGTAANDDVRVRFGKDPLHENEGGLPHLFQPVPVHTEGREYDQLLLLGNACPRHQVLMHRKRKSPEFHDVLEKNADFLSTAQKISGRQTFTIFDLVKLADTWTVFKAHSVPLPKQATPDIVDKARNLSNWLLTFGNEGTEVHRLRAGLLLYNIQQRMHAMALKQAGMLPPGLDTFVHRFVLFSAHDTTVAATLAAMRVFDGKYPPYNSTIFWELFKDDKNQFTVHVEYNGKPLILPGCSDEYCPIKEYITSLENVMVPGEDARIVECLTGWKRYTAMAYYAVTGRKKDILGDFVIPGPDNSTSSSGSVILSAVVLILTLAGVIAILRARARYGGYTRTNSELNPEEIRPKLADNYEGRPILM